MQRNLQDQELLRQNPGLYYNFYPKSLLNSQMTSGTEFLPQILLILVENSNNPKDIQKNLKFY